MVSSTIINTLVSYNTALLRKQIAENSKKIDQYLTELRELEIKICGKDIVKSIA